MAGFAGFHAACIALHTTGISGYPHGKIIPVVAVPEVEHDKAFAAVTDQFT